MGKGNCSLSVHLVSHTKPTDPDFPFEMIERIRPLDNAIDEWLRMWTPAQGLGRTIMHDMEIGGRQFRSGERIYLWLAGANRDPLKGGVCGRGRNPTPRISASGIRR